VEGAEHAVGVFIAQRRREGDFDFHSQRHGVSVGESSGRFGVRLRGLGGFDAEGAEHAEGIFIAQRGGGAEGGCSYSESRVSAGRTW